MAYRGPRTTEFEERDYYPPAPRRSAPDLDEREFRRRAVTRSPPREREPPAFLRDEPRRSEAGPMVLRQRDVETFDRHRRSPSPVRVREERIMRRPRSVSPPHMHDHEHEHSRTRVVERERVRSPSVVRQRSPSPRPMRFVERRRRSSSMEREHIHTRIVERERERIPSPSPSPPPPPPPPPVVRGPTIEREVITHYRDIDHGTMRVRRPSPPPSPRPRARERETDIDIDISKNRTEVDIRRTDTRERSRSRERRSRYHDDELVVRRNDDLLIVDEHSGRRRAHSAAPMRGPSSDEARRIAGKIDSRGRMGEAWNGATKDWAIVDVPPGTERVRMDGVGGGSTDTSWERYSGVRRTQFIPERDGQMVPAREPSPRRGDHEHLGVSVHDREIDIDIERTSRRSGRPGPPPPPPQQKAMWTEITKDLVVREAIMEMGYEYEETDQFFYVMEYLKYDDVLRLTELSADIRGSRPRRRREIEFERDFRDDYRYDFDQRNHLRRPRWDDERVREHEFIYDSRTGPRGYLR